MKRFHFPLNCLVRLREHSLEQAMEHLRHATEQRIEAEKRLQQCQRDVQACEEALDRAFLEGTLDPRHISSSHAHLRELAKLKTEAETSLARQRQAEGEAVQSLRNRKMDCQTLVRLKEKAWNAHLREFTKEEEAEAEAFHNSRNRERRD